MVARKRVGIEHCSDSAKNSQKCAAKPEKAGAGRGRRIRRMFIDMVLGAAELVMEHDLELVLTQQPSSCSIMAPGRCSRRA